jgi:hypothetical protein
MASPPLSLQLSIEIERAPEGSHIDIQNRHDPVTGADTTSLIVDKPDGTTETTIWRTQDDVTTDVGRITHEPDGTTEVWNEETGISQTRNPDGSIDIWNEHTGEQTHIPPPEQAPADGEDEVEPSDEDPAEKGACTDCGPQETPPETSIWDDIWSFGKGVVEGAVAAVVAIGLGVAAAAISPVLGVFVGVGLLALGVYGAYQLISNWGGMSRSERLQAIGGLVGGVAVGGIFGAIRRPKPPRIPRTPPKELPPPKVPARPPSRPPRQQVASNPRGNRGRRTQALGRLRESRVAKITGGRRSGELVSRRPWGKTDIDVVGPNGELISVGGPGKASNLGNLGRELHILKQVAKERGTKALAYFEEGTPRQALDLARKLLGPENVHLFSL